MDDKLLNQIELSGAHHDYLATKPLTPWVWSLLFVFLSLHELFISETIFALSQWL